MSAEIIVWIDREGRSETAEEISVAISQALASAGADETAIHVLINDRTVENVILADEELIRRTFGIPEYSYASEGANGKTVMKALHRSLEQSYREMQHGVRLLKATELKTSALVSPCAAAFLKTFTKECWWIERPV